MNHKIKSFLVAIISMKAIAAAVHPLRAPAQRNWDVWKPFHILEQTVTIAKKVSAFSYTGIFGSIKITLWSHVSQRKICALRPTILWRKIPLYQALSDLFTLSLNTHTTLDVICHSAASFCVGDLEAWEVQARNIKKASGKKNYRWCHREPKHF